MEEDNFDYREYLLNIMKSYDPNDEDNKKYNDNIQSFKNFRDRFKTWEQYQKPWTNNFL